MRRHEVGGVVGGGRVDLVAAGGLEADDGVAEAVEGEAEGAVGDGGVGFGGPHCAVTASRTGRGGGRRRRGRWRGGG